MSSERSSVGWLRNRSLLLRSSSMLHYALILLFAVAAYWPLSSFHHATRWDSVETYFPFRYFISDCLRNGELPLWMPYQLGGYPFYADPQSGAWYPVAWLLCLIGPYNLQSFATEFILTVFLGGAGMYSLARSFRIGARAALIMGITYTACGFFVSNAEHLTWVVSACWLPWVFWGYHCAVTRRKYGYALLTGLFLAFLLSGGYPAFITVASYLLILFFLVSIFRRQNTSSRWRLISLHAAMAGTFLVLGAGAMLSWYQAFPLISRGAGLSLADIFVHPFSPRCFDSFLLPFATLADKELYDSDISMRNAYMGLCTVLMLPFAVPQLRKRKLLFIALLALVCLAAAMGAYLPVREWLYRFVPMMHMFRFPSLFRIFFMIGAIIIAGHGLQSFLSDVPGNRRKLALIIALVLAFLGVVFSASVAEHGLRWPWGHSIHSFKVHLPEAVRPELIQLQSMLQLLLLGCLLAVCLYRRGRVLSSRLLIVFCCIDMFMAASLNAFGTVVAFQPRDEQEAPITSAPRNFPVPDNTKPVSAITDTGRHLGLMRTNTSMYFKTPASDGYNTFLLNTFNRLEASLIRDSVRANPYLYFATGLSVGSDSLPLPSRSLLRVDSTHFVRFQGLRTIPIATRSIRVERFLPNRIEAVVSTPDSAVLNLQQNYMEGWSMTLDGQEQALVPANYSQMASIIPPGEHRVLWRFEPPLIRLVALLSVGSLFLVLAGLAIYRKRLL